MKEKKGIRFTRCRDCNELICLSDYDFSPDYFYNAEKDTVRVIMRNDRKSFEERHKKHQLEDLQVIEGSFITEGLYMEPVKASYFEVTNGSERFVVKKWRKDIYAPLTYELIPGRLVLKETTFSVSREDIRKQFLAEVKIDEQSKAKVTEFINVVEKVISKMDERDLNGRELSETGRAGCFFVNLREDQIRKILDGCCFIFSDEEIGEIERFIRENNEYNGVMTVLVKQLFEIQRDEAPKMISEKVYL